MNRKKDYERVVKQAKELWERDNWVILDTETTGLYEAEICEIAIIDKNKSVLLNTRIKPSQSIPKQATSIHGITNSAVANSPSFTDIYPQICKAIEGNTVIIYNSSFDLTILDYCCKLANLPLLKIDDECMMNLYSTFVGDWSDYHGNYKWQKLYGGDHSALGDCKATHDVFGEIAGSSPIYTYQNTGIFDEVS